MSWWATDDGVVIGDDYADICGPLLDKMATAMLKVNPNTTKEQLAATIRFCMAVVNPLDAGKTKGETDREYEKAIRALNCPAGVSMEGKAKVLAGRPDRCPGLGNVPAPEGASWGERHAARVRASCPVGIGPGRARCADPASAVPAIAPGHRPG